MPHSVHERRKRQFTTGVIIGAVTVGLLVLAKRTPRDRWAETLARLTKDGLRLARLRYGVVAGPLFDIADHVLGRFETNPAPGTPPKNE